MTAEKLATSAKIICTWYNNALAATANLFFRAYELRTRDENF